MQNKKSEKADLENKKGVFFLIGLLVSLCLVLLAFEWKSPARKVVDLGTSGNVADEEFFIPPTKVKEEKKLPPKPLTVPIFELVDNTADINEIPLMFESDFAGEALLNYNDYVFRGSNKDKFAADDPDFFIVVEERPEFPGGERALQHYIASAVNYPVVAQENGIKGKVLVSFIIDEYGNVTNVEIYRSVHPSLDNEALRVIRTLPKWKPGKQGGEAVRVKYFVPINFELK
ncbi:MAG: energy transducer TonB [Draconibacterium sp.]|nr:MAG: energy transducer TonB [Draconibacterium sp.]